LNPTGGRESIPERFDTRAATCNHEYAVFESVRYLAFELIDTQWKTDFTAAGPNESWVADITFISTWTGNLYLAVVVDAWSRRVVRWPMITHLRTELVLEALEMAIARAIRWG
jgi:transposase InsO family protein